VAEKIARYESLQIDQSESTKADRYYQQNNKQQQPISSGSHQQQPTNTHTSNSALLFQAKDK
jgi:hypothetical protein